MEYTITRRTFNDLIEIGLQFEDNYKQTYYLVSYYKIKEPELILSMKEIIDESDNCNISRKDKSLFVIPPSSMKVLEVKDKCLLDDAQFDKLNKIYTDCVLSELRISRLIDSITPGVRIAILNFPIIICEEVYMALQYIRKEENKDKDLSDQISKMADKFEEEFNKQFQSYLKFVEFLSSKEITINEIPEDTSKDNTTEIDMNKHSTDAN